MSLCYINKCLFQYIMIMYRWKSKYWNGSVDLFRKLINFKAGCAVKASRISSVEIIFTKIWFYLFYFEFTGIEALNGNRNKNI